MLGFTTHQSTAIAQALMVGGTLAGLLLNWLQRHPTADRPLIDVALVSCYISWYRSYKTSSRLILTGLAFSSNANQWIEYWSRRESSLTKLADHCVYCFCTWPNGI